MYLNKTYCKIHICTCPLPFLFRRLSKLCNNLYLYSDVAINLFLHIIKTDGSPLSCICSHPCWGDITQPAIPRSLQQSLPARVLNQNSKQSFCVPYIYKCLDHFSLFDLIVLTIQSEKHKS